jgi:hypothetical protein
MAKIEAKGKKSFGAKKVGKAKKKFGPKEQRPKRYQGQGR